MKKIFNVAIAFENDAELLEKDNFFIINNVKVVEESTGRCFDFILDKNIKPINSSFFNSENEIGCAFTKNEEDKLNYNFSYKCYFIVSSALKGNELKNKLIDLIIEDKNKDILRLNTQIFKDQLNLKCLFDMK